MEASCSKKTLARTDLGAVEMCSCGAAHLSIGAVTMRICPDALEQLAVLLGRAAAALDTSTMAAHAALWRPHGTS
jgi:hypothetical protein